jgi:zinc D-Ala-D-Ala carboxypeptidase
MPEFYGGMTEEAERAPAGYDPGPDDTHPPTLPGYLEVDEPPRRAIPLADIEFGGPRGLADVSDRQALLSAIGFPIRVDGDAGPATTQAITWFQEAWTRTNLTIDGLWGPATEAAARACIADGRRISAHFHLPEFACSHCHWPRVNRTLVRGLERYRAEYFKVSGLQIVSGYRCSVHNAAIGGAQGSQHLYGRAANVPPHGDGGKLITVEAVKALRLFAGLEYQPRYTGRGCTHVDVRAGGSVINPSIFAWG